MRTLPPYWDPYHGGPYDPPVEVKTEVPIDRLEALAEALVRVPDGFHVHPKIQRVFEQRRRMVRGERPVDWGMAESLAFGSLLMEGTPVRLSGEDSRRGTFNQRHAVVIDRETGEEFFPTWKSRMPKGFSSVREKSLMN